MDRITSAQRSENMRRIRGTDSAPELRVRHALFRMGYRYRLHVKGLAGKPDIVLPSRRKVIFVHGCFWHRHPGCRYAYTPKSRLDFWSRKFAGNVARDDRVQAELAAGGWQVLVLWECETQEDNLLSIRLASFVGDQCGSEPPP